VVVYFARLHRVARLRSDSNSAHVESRILTLPTTSESRSQCRNGVRDAMLRPKLLLLDEPSFGLAPLVVQEIFRILRTINRNGGVSMLLVEQNANIPLELADYAYLIETGCIVMGAPRPSSLRPRRAPCLSRLLRRGKKCKASLAQLLSGVADGGIYASLALALVMIYQATHHVNFAQAQWRCSQPTSPGR
jgi:ABC-type sulfate/molybdate transport systems ATPase subunit